MKVGFLPPTAGDVVPEQTPLTFPWVVSGEQRDDDQPLQGERKVLANHLRETVRLSLEGEGVALHLLVVLELSLKEPDDLGGLPGGAGDADGGEIIGGKDLLDPLVGDVEAFGRAAVSGHDHAVGELHREDGGSLCEFDSCVSGRH